MNINNTKWHKLQIIIALFFLIFEMYGCADEKVSTSNIHSDFYSCKLEDAFIYKTSNNTINVLDYETMSDSLLCNRPNCTHVNAECIIARLGRNIPVFYNEKAYYFIDDKPEIIEIDNGKQDLKLGSTLYAFDMNTNKEKRLYHVKGGSVASQYGWLLFNNKLFFVSNEFYRQYDENGRILEYSNVGGNMSLRSICLDDGTLTDYGKLYDINALSAYYPDALYSASANMKGLYDNKIYFDIFFRESYDSQTSTATLRRYVTYFDLNNNVYCGEPSDYTNIDFGSVAFISREYLAITKEHQVSVYKAGKLQPFIYTDDNINEYQKLSVFDDRLFGNGWEWDINTNEVRKIEKLKEKTIVWKYGSSYIISNLEMQSDFEKIDTSDLH